MEKRFTLYNDDCLKVMDKLIKEKSKVDAIITDPPYEIANKGGGINKKREFINEIDAMGMCNSGFDIISFLNKTKELMDSYNAICFCSKKQLRDYINWSHDNDMQYSVGVWHKQNPIPLCNNKYLNDIEYWLYIKDNKSKIYGNYHSKSMVYTSIINKKDKEIYKHPTIKPISLIEKFITNHTIIDNVILDPFMGSGTCGVACKNLDRKFIGIELDKEYFNIAKNRIENHNVQLKLF